VSAAKTNCLYQVGYESDFAFYAGR
jgi:hypothetical protein